MQPTIKQMAVRMNEGHFNMLLNAFKGRPGGWPGMTAGQIRGTSIVSKTLSGWGAMQAGAITETGVKLILLYRKRFPGVRVS